MALIAPTAVSAAVPDFVPPQYVRFFQRAADERSLSERMLNIAGFTAQTYGRSFALVVGVSRYPNIPGPNGNLAPAAEDVRKITAYLSTYERFDQIVVLKDDDVTISNLSYFIETYFPKQLRAFPKSRFLFVYSGHGMNENTKGYLLTSAAKSLTDRDNVIPMTTLRAMLQEVIDPGYHVLALINACYSGAFFRRPFGDSDYVPKNPGAHAITAGGTNERTWHNGDLGSGSIFFEMFFAALDGRASKGSVVTVSELTAYLQRHVSSFTDQAQNPLGSDLSPTSSTGGFFFYNRAPLVEKGMAPRWNPDVVRAFGPIAPAAQGNPQRPTGSSGFAGPPPAQGNAKGSASTGSGGSWMFGGGSDSSFADSPAKGNSKGSVSTGSGGSWMFSR
jgi:hypothetical protein